MKKLKHRCGLWILSVLGIVFLTGMDAAAYSERDGTGYSETGGTEGETGEDILGISTKSPETAVVGKTIRYVVKSVSASADSESDTFLLQCTVPEGMELVSVYTGTYSDDVGLQLICRTEGDGVWHSWGENISSAQGGTFDTSSISLAEGERISAFALSAESVPKGFSLREEDPCHYSMNVVDDGSGGDGLARVSAYLGDRKSAKESRFVTAVMEDAAGTVQTGDGNILYAGSLVLLSVSVSVLAGYAAVRIVSRKWEGRMAAAGASVSFKKDRRRQGDRKMSELLGKRPG